MSQCPKCGCQTKDPFGMGKTIHDESACSAGFRYLNSIDLWVERGKTMESVIDGLPERSGDECYSAYHWLENMVEEKTGAPLFPQMAYQIGAHNDTRRLLGFMKPWLDKFPPEMQELFALAAEHLSRQASKPNVPNQSRSEAELSE